ncbi:hypothetical protein B0H14DRAFT_3454534 [Mycena olivaceomarginata]|nr:hypothetical protein B0H14DRAFT_3454534 [Mycena olivaceomarginata]
MQGSVRFANWLLLLILGHGILMLASPHSGAYSSTFASPPTVAAVGTSILTMYCMVSPMLLVFTPPWKKQPKTEPTPIPTRSQMLCTLGLAYCDVLCGVILNLISVAILRRGHYDAHPLLDLSHAARVGAVAGADSACLGIRNCGKRLRHLRNFVDMWRDMARAEGNENDEPNDQIVEADGQTSEAMAKKFEAND